MDKKKKKEMERKNDEKDEEKQNARLPRLLYTAAFDTVDKPGMSKSYGRYVD